MTTSGDSDDFTALKAAADIDASYRTEHSTLPFSIDWIAHFNSRMAALPLESPLIFMISSHQAKISASLTDSSVVRIPCLMQDQVQRAGIIIVGNAPGSRGCFIPADGRDVTQLIQWAESNGIGAEFSLVGVSGKRETTVFPEGLLKDEESYLIDHIALNGLVTDQQILDGLDRFERGVLNASDIKDGVWLDRGAWIPFELAERKIQDQLIIFFRASFDSASTIVLQEISNPDGRCDLSVKSKHYQKSTNSSTVREFILELKALKSFTENTNKVPPGVHKAAVEKGIQQAIDYKATLKVESVFLCVFDLRKEPTTELKDKMKADCRTKDILPWWEAILPNTAARRKVSMLAGAN